MFVVELSEKNSAQHSSVAVVAAAAADVVVVIPTLVVQDRQDNLSCYGKVITLLLQLVHLLLYFLPRVNSTVN